MAVGGVSPSGIRARAERRVTRFTVSQRLQHLVVMLSFTLLVLTGLPQKFHEAGLSQWIVVSLGGIDATRLIHRITGFVFAGAAVFHVVYLLRYFAVKRGRPTMVLTRKDFRDAVTALRYGLGLSPEWARAGRFDYREKFEYWGILFGGAVMIVTGAMLMYPTEAAQVLPGQLIPAAKMAHSWEALMALLIIVIWHLYSTHFTPGKFPLDRSIFSGKISVERMWEEHPLEYEEMVDRGEGGGGLDGAEGSSRRPPRGE